MTTNKNAEVRGSIRSRRSDVFRALDRASDQRVKFVLEQIQDQDDVPRKIRIDALAKTVHLSTSRLRHLFGKQIGIPIGRYIKLLQLQKARELLENSFLEVKEVAARVGVNDLSHFIRDYKKVYRETPSWTRTNSEKRPAHSTVQKVA
jgi:AraC family transcriptional regulator, arabinose operon regulatory protein